MADAQHCAATCRRWALTTWRALTAKQRTILLRLSGGAVRLRASLVWAQQAELIVGIDTPELTPLGRLVVSVGAAELARGGGL